MPSTATVTAPLGPGLSATSLSLTGVTELLIYPAPRSIAQIKHSGGYNEFAINATTTFTLSPSSGDLTIVISQ